MPDMLRLRAVAYTFLCLLLAACGGGSTRGFGSKARIMAPGSTSVSGGMGAEPAALFLAGLDTDLDANVSEAELSSAFGRLWQTADPDTSGALSIHELNAWRERWLGTSDGWPGPFHFDADGNSSISRKEFQAGLQVIFRDFDKNVDGVVVRDELLAPRARTRDRGPPAASDVENPPDRERSSFPVSHRDPTPR